MVFGIFNLGPLEVLVLLIGGLCMVAVPVGIIVLVVVLNRGQSRTNVPNRLEALEEENRCLREELAKLKKDRG
jgi:hypothetical protein